MDRMVAVYTSKELSKATWADFEKFFSQGNGWDHCQCMHFHRPGPLPKTQWLHSRVERAGRNRLEKRKLVEQGKSHGILVYAEGEPVGWCQYGPGEELPRIDNSRNYRCNVRPNDRDLTAQAASMALWRITCFVVDKKYRKRGAATAALQGALESIRKKGGGVVEAYPLIDWKKLCRAEVRRRGRAPSFGNVSTHGTVSMFEKEGFKIIGPYGPTNVVMRRMI